MTKIMFVCHGNICRSPMAEFVLVHMARERGVGECFSVASCATSTEEIGNSVYPPARRKLAEHKIDCTGKTARQLRRSDYSQWDYLVGMDSANLRNMHRIFGGDPEGKVSLLLDWTDRPGQVADPWYTDRFDITYRDIEEGCEAWLDKLIPEAKKKGAES